MSRPVERLAVHAAVARLASSSEVERFRLYRLHLQATVTRASPVAVELAAQGGLAMADVATFLPLAPHWPNAGATVRRPWRSARTRTARAPWMAADASRETMARLGRTGVAVRANGDPLGDLGFLPEGMFMEAVSRTGETTLHTRRGDGLFVMPHDLPETVLVSMRDRRLETVVSHPATDCRGYLVEEAYRDEFIGATIVRFRTGAVSVELPWVQELLREVSAYEGQVADLLGHHPARLAERYYLGGAGGVLPVGIDPGVFTKGQS